MEVALVRIAVLGPGAIGTVIAGCLQAAGHSALLCGRTARRVIEIRRDGDDTVVLPGPILTDPSRVDAPCDVVFVAVKGTQLDGVGEWLSVLCTERTVVCVLQNGIEQEVNVGKLVGCAVLPAVVWFPAETQHDGGVWLRDRPMLTLPNRPEAGLIRDVFVGSDCRIDLADDFAAEAWQKLLQNAVAGLMVLTGRRAGMYRRPDVAAVAAAYLRECLSVARADGVQLPDELVSQIVDTFGDYPPDMGSSILADREAGRPLEWDLRNGVIARRARAHGIATPISDVLLPLLAAASDGPG